MGSEVKDTVQVVIGRGSGGVVVCQGRGTIGDL